MMMTEIEKQVNIRNGCLRCFMKILAGLENLEGQSQPGGSSLEELQQQINSASLVKVQQYYRKLRYCNTKRMLHVRQPCYQ